MGGQYSAAKFYDDGPKTPAGESSSDVSLFQQLLQHIENETKRLLDTITNMKMGSMGQIDDKSSRAILADELRSAEMKLHTLNDELCDKSVDPKTERYVRKEPYALQRENQPMHNRSEKFESLQKQLVTTTERLSFVESQLEIMKEKNKIQKQTIGEQAVRSEQYKEEAEKQKSINSDLLTRLSKLTGDKLNTDNPNIADLSDPNRPTKIAEMISELYDNEWTNAFEALQTRKVDDKEIVNILLETFMDVYNFCKGKSIELMSLTEKSIKHLFEDFDKTVKETNSKLKSATLSPKVKGNFDFSRENAKASLNLLFMKWQDRSKTTEFEEGVDITSVEDVLPKVEEEVKKVRKNVGLALVPIVNKAYLKPRWNKLCVHALKPYIKKCVHVAWLMCVQTPPMAIAALPKHGEKLDTNLYREYSRRGQTVDFVVWPVVLLKEPQNEMLSVMTKGVAEVKEL